ncbi:hypothetical protein WJX64_16130 [Leifsonia sp. YIM 134122]|uniref:Prepilin-type N-terminal cleavage/methylation domain-containing protein n=1 Tax=Leifsonia stereocauli TaxID=3134136 RepID=A0ABU9W8U8_9MICO
MIRVRRRLAGQVSGDKGLGVAELVVAISLLAVLMTLVVSLVVNVSRTFTREASATDSANVAALGMREVTRVIRAGTEIPVQTSVVNDPVFILAKPTEVTMYAYLDTSAASPKPIMVNFSVNATTGDLQETRWDATPVGTRFWSFATTSTWQKLVARKIIAPTGTEQTLFSYYKSDGTEMNLAAGASLTAAQLRDVAAVQVSLKVQADVTGRAAPVLLQNTVGIPNLGVSRVAS